MRVVITTEQFGVHTKYIAVVKKGYEFRSVENIVSLPCFEDSTIVESSPNMIQWLSYQSSWSIDDIQWLIRRTMPIRAIKYCSCCGGVMDWKNFDNCYMLKDSVWSIVHPQGKRGFLCHICLPIVCAEHGIVLNEDSYNVCICAVNMRYPNIAEGVLNYISDKMPSRVLVTYAKYCIKMNNENPLLYEAIANKVSKLLEQKNETQSIN